MPPKMAFVTVGTTSFDSLIETVSTDEFIEMLHGLGYGKLVIQFGRGTVEPAPKSRKDFQVEVYKYKPSLEPDILAADLVISHCGAGTCLEVLEAKKTLVVVINDELADNHQMELAKQLQESGYLAYATCSTVAGCVMDVAQTDLSPYTQGDPQAFSGWLDNFVGFGKRA